MRKAKAISTALAFGAAATLAYTLQERHEVNMAWKTAIRKADAIWAISGILFLSGAHAIAQPAPKTGAPEPKEGRRERFSATTSNLGSSSGEKLRIDVFRWSSDGDREKLVSAFKEKGAEQLDPTLQALPESGYIWAGDESLGYSVHYAYRQELNNGGERIILATDRPLGSWSGHPWTAKTESNSVSYAFTVIELVLNGSGRGEVKTSLNSKVVLNEAYKTIALESSESSPAVLKNVQRADSASKY